MSSLAANPAAAQDLFSVTPAYLLPRHAHFPPLDTKLRVTPGYADAPRTGNVTIVYTYLSPQGSGAFSSLPYARASAAHAQLTRCACAILRDGLLSHGGYEVRENSGNFLLAFGRAADALVFATAMQLEFMQVRAP
jgi:hypothetical protein